MAELPDFIRAIGASVGKNVRNVRQIVGMTQEGLSERLEGLGLPMAVSVIRALENGRRNVTVTELAALALALDTSAVRLLGPSMLEMNVNDPYDEHEVAAWLRGDVKLEPASLLQMHRTNLDESNAKLDREELALKTLDTELFPAEYLDIAQSRIEDMREFGDYMRGRIVFWEEELTNGSRVD